MGVQAELDRLVDGALPGAFVHIEETDGPATFVTAGGQTAPAAPPMTAAYPS